MRIDAYNGRSASRSILQGVNVTNQIIGMSYDAAGNMISDSSHQYRYDAHKDKVDVSKLSEPEKALFNTITNTDFHATLEIAAKSDLVDFGSSEGGGKNTVDRSDLNLLKGATSQQLVGNVISRTRWRATLANEYRKHLATSTRQVPLGKIMPMRMARKLSRNSPTLVRRKLRKRSIGCCQILSKTGDMSMRTREIILITTVVAIFVLNIKGQNKEPHGETNHWYVNFPEAPVQMRSLKFNSNGFALENRSKKEVVRYQLGCFPVKSKKPKKLFEEQEMSLPAGSRGLAVDSTAYLTERAECEKMDAKVGLAHLRFADGTAWNKN